MEKDILILSNEGLSLREIGERLDLSHTSIIRRQRKIAALASRLGFEAPRTASLRRAAGSLKADNG
jgi:DNA-binding NarL/FixJ family response regulator